MKIKLKVVIVFFFLLTACGSQTSMAKLVINGNTIDVEVAQSHEQLTKGLAGRTSLEDSAGMLFIHPDYKVRNYWMKEMQFSLDIIWIKDNQILGISENVPLFTTDGQISRVESGLPVNKVLEVLAGWSGKNNVKVGDYISGLD